MKEEIVTSLQEVSKLYTEPSTEEGAPPLHPYTLRGISIANDKTYICRRTRTAHDATESPEGAGLREDQWWSIEISDSRAWKPVTVEVRKVPGRC